MEKQTLLQINRGIPNFKTYSYRISYQGMKRIHVLWVGENHSKRMELQKAQDSISYSGSGYPHPPSEEYFIIIFHTKIKQHIYEEKCYIEKKNLPRQKMYTDTSDVRKCIFMLKIKINVSYILFYLCKNIYTRDV